MGEVKTLARTLGRGENVGERLWKGVESGGINRGYSQWGSPGSGVKITCRSGEGGTPVGELAKQDGPRAGGMGEGTEMGAGLEYPDGQRGWGLDSGWARH